MRTQALRVTEQNSWTDEEIIDRVIGGQTALYELLVRRYNQKLYRAVRAVADADRSERSHREIEVAPEIRDGV
jgi:hypothetical protein